MTQLADLVEQIGMTEQTTTPVEAAVTSGKPWGPGSPKTIVRFFAHDHPIWGDSEN